MRYLSQLGVILFLCVTAETVVKILPFAVPASVLAMLLLLALLFSGLIKLDYVEGTADFLVNNIAFLFVPSTVSMFFRLNLVAGYMLPFLFICIFAACLTFGAAVLTTAGLMKLLQRGEETAANE